jgi:hypothetical protein
MGFRLIPRAEFLALLEQNAAEGGKPGRWSVEAAPEVVADWQSPGAHNAENGRQAVAV